jgi:UDP-N-acetylglucosamine 1-carboxyvinyltransferase
MEYIEINGGNKLEGSVKIAGAKNAGLPIIMASILSSSKTILKNIPNLTDIDNGLLLLKDLGFQIAKQMESLEAGTQTISIFPSEKINHEVNIEVASSMRASIWALGPMIARYNEAIIPSPGGCNLGARSIDMHIDALQKMGAKIDVKDGKIFGRCTARLEAIDYEFYKVSVGATANILMAATLAHGTTTLSNCAIEPEITDLANFLLSIGAKIFGIGTPDLTIVGVEVLQGSEYRIIPDRLEASTYAVAASITKGDVIIENINPNIMSNIIEYLCKIDVEVYRENSKLRIISKNIILPTNIKTGPYPDFPTDMQAQFSALLTLAKGTSQIDETIFENRFAHLNELNKMGADIKILNNQKWIINGVKKLYGARLFANDLRGSASLILAALGAEGVSTIHNLEYLDRGYANLEKKLFSLGAEIKRVRENLYCNVNNASNF